MTPELILKEDIKNYKIAPAKEDKSSQWLEKLEYALRLGNQFKGKTVITFQTNEGPKMVQTTVWSVTQKHLELKGGIDIPLSSLLDISF